MGWLEDNGLYNALKLISQGDGAVVDNSETRHLDLVGTPEHQWASSESGGIAEEDALRMSREPDAGYELNPDGTPRFAEGEIPDIAQANTGGMVAYDEYGRPSQSERTDVHVSAREAPGDRVASRRMSESDSGPAGGNRYSFFGMQADPEERRGIREAADWWDDSVTGAVDAVGGVLRELPGGDPEHTETLWGRGLIEDAARLPARALEAAGRGYSHEAVMGGFNTQPVEAAEVANIDTGRYGEGTESMMVEARRRGDTAEIIAGQVLPWAMSAPIMEAAGAASGLTQLPKLARAVGVAGDAAAGYLGGRGYAQEQLGEDEHQEGLIGGALGGALGILARYGLAGVGGRVNAVRRAQKAPKAISEEIPQRMLGGDFGAPPRQGPLHRMAPMEGPGVGEYLQHGPARLPNAQDVYGHLDVPQPQGRSSAIADAAPGPRGFGSADTGAVSAAAPPPASVATGGLGPGGAAAQSPERIAQNEAANQARQARALDRNFGILDEEYGEREGFNLWRETNLRNQAALPAPPGGVPRDQLDPNLLRQELPAIDAEALGFPDFARAIRERRREGAGIIRGEGRGLGGQRMAPVSPDDVIPDLPSDAYRMDPPRTPVSGADRAYDPRFDYHGVPDALPEPPTPEQARAMAAGLPDARPLPEVPSEEALGARGRGSLLDEYIDGPPPPAADVPPMAPAADEMRIGALETGEMSPISEGLPGLADDFDAAVDHPRFDLRAAQPQPEHGQLLPGEGAMDVRRRQVQAGADFRNLDRTDQARIQAERAANNADRGGLPGFDTLAQPPGHFEGEFAYPGGTRGRQFIQDLRENPGRGARARTNAQMREEYPEWWAARGNQYNAATRGQPVDAFKPIRRERGLETGAWDPEFQGPPPERDVNQMGPDPEVAMDILRRMRDRGRQAAGNLEMPGMPDMRRLQIPEGAPPETALGRVMERYGDRMKRKGIHAMTYAAPAAAATGHPRAAAGFLGAGAAMLGGPKIVRVLDNMITRGRYGNIGPLTALRDALRAGRGQEMRGVIAAHTAMLEDPEFRQAFRAAEGEIAGGGDDDGYQWHDDAANAATPTSEGGPADADAYEWH